MARSGSRERRRDPSLVPAGLDERLARLNATRAAIADLEGSSESLALEPSAAVLDALRSLRVGMEENADLYFGASDDQRGAMLVAYDGAGALLEELAPAGAAV